MVMKSQYRLVNYLPVNETGPMTGQDSPLVALRRARLQQWIDERYGGSQAEFIKAAGVNQGEISALLKNKSFGEKRATTLERAAGMPAGYLSAFNAADPAEVEADAHRLDAELLVAAHKLLSAVRQYDLGKPGDADAFCNAYETAAKMRSRAATPETFTELFAGWQSRIDSISAELEELRRLARKQA